jgi:4-amino-4-deoxy-L-arabinose transferase-like glycosyltransferase
MFALNAKNFVPQFYFWHLDNFWATPVIVYWAAIFLKFLPFNETWIRFPSALLAVINIGLMMYLTDILFKKRYLTILSGVLLALTPAFFINSRILIDNIYPVTFVLLWLIFLVKNKTFLAGLSLGLGFHSYHAAKIFMPLYLIMSLWKKSRILLILGFIIPILLFIPWLRAHPDTLTSQVSYANSIDRDIGSNFAGNYLSYFNPALLFTTGDRTLIHSTGRVGIFLFPMVLLMVFGALSVVLRKNTFGKMILIGFLTYPLAPAIINDPGRISRALIVIPFATLLCVYGLEFLWEQKDKVFRYLIYLVVCLSFIQFLGFLFDYFGDYRVRSRNVFNNNVGGVYESALKSTKIRPVKTFYVDKNIFQAKYYLEFYKQKLGIYPSEVIYFDSNSEDFTKFPDGSIVITNKKFLNLGGFENIETIRELDGVETYFVYFSK